MLGTGLDTLLKVLLLTAAAAALLPEDLEDHAAPSLQEECVSKCPDLDLTQNRTDDQNSEIGCGVRCKIDQCTKGCEAWQQALDTSCQAVCNGTQELLPPKEFYCVLGCHDALNRYFQRLKAEIGTPPAPALVADSLTATSLSLEWKGVDIEKRGGGISYLVQWRYEELAETWQYCRNQSWGEGDQILVENLQPYTKYRFRVALLLKSSQHNPEPIVSAPSVVILTNAAGLPTSAPVIVRAAAVDSYRVSVSWEPGPFPNGPLLSYVLRLQGADHSQLKDIPASENTDHYMFQNLEPNQNYSISVTMRNGVGEGPPATIYISTTPEPTVKDTQQPILILGGEHVVMKQGADMLDEPSIVYETAENDVIRGVAIHVASAQLFVSTSLGYVYRISIIERSNPKIILSLPEFEPLSLSVDWLNLQLYVLGEVKHATTVRLIARCNLDGKGLTVAAAGIFTRPSHIEVDPYNGYLFWVSSGAGGGLYRLDLADIGNGIKYEVRPHLILEDTHLGAFTVDHTNFRLLVPHHTQNTVISVSLDGREVVNLRANTQKPRFNNVVSLAMANGLFYWTNGEEVLTEGYHSGQNRYFHNAYPDRSDGSFVSVNVLMNASQPVPVPVNPPTGVQAVLGAERAKVSWQAPHLLGGQGKGAWQNWSYELEIKDESSGETIHQKDIAGSSHTVHNLRERSEYSIKAAAYTSAGRGPWSSEFRGRTLRDGSHASILWSSNEGLLRSDVTGENIDTLIYKASLKESESEFHIVDVSWYKDVLYVVGNNSALYHYNISNHQKTKLNIQLGAGSVAVDWISKKLYWANPKQQTITRANLNGSQQEPISILAIVKELMIDSLEAYLYWSTGHAVEVARLNGQDKRYYHVDEIFNGKQVMGLTLDTENRYVYWIVRSYESGSVVYRAPTSERIPINHKIVPEKVSTLQHPYTQGPLCYFSEHLLWLQDDRNAVIGDLSGQNTAVINGITLSGLHMVAVMDPALHQYPKNLTSDDVVVLPNAVDLDSIRVEGTWRNFNISWDPVKNINYGTVFYEVKFADYINTNSNPEITIETTMPYNNSDQIVPYSDLDVNVKAFTYWESAHNSRKILKSPQSVPSQPTSPRAFVEYYKDILNEQVDIFTVFRWNQPEFPNGLITKYTVQCWFIANQEKIHICDKNSTAPVTVLEYTVHNLLPNTTYYFQVQAHTEIGAGPYTDLINVSTAYENPVPRLLVSTTDAVWILDLDQETNYTITRHVAIEVSYLASEDKIYWINDMQQELVTSEMNGDNVMKILALNNTALSFCIDWVAKNLYWTESKHRESNGYIMKLDLTMWQAGVIKYENIVKTGRNILNLDILPSHRSLYWIELTKNDRGIIMQSDLDGKDVRPFFRNVENMCSCPHRTLVRPVMAIDKTNIQNPAMYWMSLEGHLNMADIYGCACKVILSASFTKPTFLTVDKVNIYWSNTEENQIYFTKKDHHSLTNKENASEPVVKNFYLPSVRSIKGFGKSLQPYPIVNCLIPRQMAYKVEKVTETANSIIVKLPQPITERDCEKYNLSATQYTIYVSQCLENEPNKCENHESIKIQTYEQRYEIHYLKPFTKYMLKLALSNYYSDLKSMSLEFGPGVVLRTGAGKPSAPENVTIEALTPILAAVYWMPPKILNSAAVNYEVHWRSVGLVNGMRQKGEQLIKEPERTADGRFYTTLQSLLPGQDYLVYVRVYPAHFNEFYNESLSKIVRMYSKPNNLTLSGASVNSLNVSWVPSVNLTLGYVLEYKDVGMEGWQTAENIEVENDKVTYHIEGLQPRTLYKFRLKLKYPTYKKDFVWPSDGGFTFHTLGDIPSAPGMPTITRLRNSVYQLNWEPAQAHGSQVTLYRLEGIIIDDSYKQDNEANENQHWNLYYNGTDNYWIITGDMDQKYQFRVQAKNAYGFGAWSKLSGTVDLTETTGGILAAQQHLGLVLGLSVVIITIMLLCICYFFCLYRQRKEDKKTGSPSSELASLRDIPRVTTIRSNVLYASANDSTLPEIRREQITLAKFLGSGAFGEVFQGNAKDLEGPGITPIAIKMLRKGASLQEKEDFLKEAKLMSHFRHKHVLRLLGVCSGTGPTLLVLELMEAGDLLSYLRESRFLQPTDAYALRLQDLLAMCEDVARGCHYLEELHFVHRDIACRNCLVSARDRENRVVKIGDFGLARDIYKNDYYRKEGEGLLPVRWMPPESLVDGLFTSQSDVWAFGVLMWEITSLGQQPYPAMTNFEVLHHVSAGNRLPKPLNCPPALHQLMLRCWSAADTRPSFKTCLEDIITLRSNTEDTALSPVHIGHYVARKGVSNMAYFADKNQNHNNSGNSWKSSSSEGSRDMQPFLQNSHNTMLTPQSGEVPKYLEVLADNDNIVLKENPTSGYEVPRSIHISDQNLASITSKINGAKQNRKCSLPLEGPQEYKERSTEERKQSDGKLYNKRSSIASLNLPDRKAVSVSGMPEKSNTLNSLRSVSSVTKTVLKKDSFSSLNDQPKYKPSLSERRDSEASLESRSCSSLSLAPCTRPSSSLINSQTVLPLKNNITNQTTSGNGEIPLNECTMTKNTLPKIQRTHSNLQNSKANIPLVINSALLNLLRQTPVADDGNNIVTYTNINTDVVRVNGS